MFRYQLHRAVALYILAALAALALPGSRAGAETALAPATVANPAGFADLVVHVKPAVVNIATTEKPQPNAAQPRLLDPGLEEFFRRFMPPGAQPKPRQGHALGSGFITDADGTVVTNNHVVKDASKIMVTLTDGSSYPAKLIGRDDKTDIAVLKIDAKKPLPFVKFGDSKQARVGDWVIAVGNPFGLGGTVTAGILSADARDLNSGPYDSFLQIDAPINPGNSGGPLFDQSGNVIGISTAIYSPNGGSVGIGFAIPSNLVAPVVEQLKTRGSVTRGWLGVQMQSLTKELSQAMGFTKSGGVLIGKVLPESPAEAAGLRQGDIVFSVDGAPIASTHDLATVIAGSKVGGAVKIGIWRKKREDSVTVTISAQSDAPTAAVEPESNDDLLGLSLAPLTGALRTQLGLEDTVQGVVIKNVAPDSLAAESDLRSGDVILAISGEPVESLAAVRAQIQAAQQEKKTAIALLLLRDGGSYYVALGLAKS